MIIGLIIATTLPLLVGTLQMNRRSATQDRAEVIQTAIALYVSQNKRLPCPADGTRPQGNLLAGVEVPRDGIQDCEAQTNGVVPFVTLGLSDEMGTDGWLNRFTYRISSGPQHELTRDGGMDMSSCDPGHP